MNNNIIDVLNNLLKPKNAWGAVPNKSIDDAQHRLNLKFSEEYIRFLGYVGALSTDKIEINGIVPINALDVVSYTEDARRNDMDFPGNMYVIRSLHIDGILILQNFDGKVFEYYPLKGVRKIAESLSYYILSYYK